MGEFSPEEKAELQTERTLSDAELIDSGAKYVPDSKGEPVLEITEEQKEKLEKIHNPDGSEKPKWEWGPEFEEMTYGEFKKLYEKMSKEGWHAGFPFSTRGQLLEAVEKGKIELDKLYWNGSVSRKGSEGPGSIILELEGVSPYGEKFGGSISEKGALNNPTKYPAIFFRYREDSEKNF
ncbi:MAG: hypothetical protein V1896_00845 [Candidatus Zambryskibacteria bacterium]